MFEPHQVQFFAAIGRLTVVWALMESAIDAHVAIIHQRVGGNQIDKEAPWAIGRKLKFLKRCFRKIYRLHSKQDQAIDIYIQIGAASDFRHDVVHGAITQELKVDAPMIFNVLVRGETIPKIREIEISTAKIEAEADKLMVLARRTSNLASWLVAEFLADGPVLDGPDKTRG